MSFYGKNRNLVNLFEPTVLITKAVIVGALNGTQ